MTGSRRRPGAQGAGDDDEPANDTGADGSASETRGGRTRAGTTGNPFLDMMSAFHGLGEAGMASIGAATSVGQAQWQAMNDAAAAMAQLPLATLEESTRELARLRDAVHVMQGQLALFDEQLGALDAMLQPLRRWAELWGRGGDPQA